jgi:hypothetical protein
MKSLLFLLLICLSFISSNEILDHYKSLSKSPQYKLYSPNNKYLIETIKDYTSYELITSSIEKLINQYKEAKSNENKYASFFITRYFPKVTVNDLYNTYLLYENNFPCTFNANHTCVEKVTADREEYYFINEDITDFYDINLLRHNCFYIKFEEYIIPIFNRENKVICSKKIDNLNTIYISVDNLKIHKYYYRNETLVEKYMKVEYNTLIEKIIVPILIMFFAYIGLKFNH